MRSQWLIIKIGRVFVSVPAATIPLFLLSVTVAFVVWVMASR
jgi:hypothetical protein